MKAFHEAVDSDYDGFELDVFLTKDQVPLVCHGLSLESLQIVWDIKEEKY